MRSPLRNIDRKGTPDTFNTKLGWSTSSDTVIPVNVEGFSAIKKGALYEFESVRAFEIQ